MSEKFDLDKQIGQKIKEARLEFGYSQMNLADVLGFESPTAVSLIESGDRSLKIRDLIILCQLFMKDYDYFIGSPIGYKFRKI
jgi:transcriptional regulator with XRE-family HTH domain